MFLCFVCLVFQLCLQVFLFCVVASLDLTVRGTGYLYPPLHSPRDCNVVGVVPFSFFDLL